MPRLELLTDLVKPEGRLRVNPDDGGEVLKVSQQAHKQTQENCTHLFILDKNIKKEGREGRGERERERERWKENGEGRERDGRRMGGGGGREKQGMKNAVQLAS